MIKRYQIFEWSPATPNHIQDNETQSEQDEISATYEDEHDYEITKIGEEKEIIVEDTYEDEHPYDK